MAEKYNIPQNYQGGIFVWETFYGDRPNYNHYYYLPTKVLQHYGVIEYGKSGTLIRKQDNWIGWWTM